MANSTTMTYGSYNFSPVPLASINKLYNKTEDGTRIGTSFNVLLDGTLVATGTAGITNTVALKDTLREAFVQEGCAFVIKCNDAVLWSGHPSIEDIGFESTNDNWVNSIDYNVSLLFNTEGTGEDPSLAPPYIQQATESWSLEFAESPSRFSWTLPTGDVDASPYVLNMSHSISAKGKRHYTACDTVGKEAWEYARDYVATKLNAGTGTVFDAQLESSGIINLDSAIFSSFNHMRVTQTDIAGGNYNVTENWIVLNTGVGIPGNGLETFNVDIVQNTDSDLTSMAINGNIVGVESRTYGLVPSGFTTTTTKYAAASGYWAVVEPRLYYRAQLLHTNAVSTRNNIRALNTSVLSSSVGHSPTNGTITYSYTYDDRPSNCITGALTEVISINDSNPTDIFASIAVLGRQLGPVLQDVNTITATRRDVSFEIVAPPATGCTAALLRTVPNSIKTDVAALLCGFQLELSGSYNQIFKDQDQESWNPKTGRYSRNVGWTYQDCSITGSTSLC